MKATFRHNTVNGPFEDPVIYVKLFKEKRAFMFDCGDITPLGPGSMLKVTDLFITHTHIDHFVGFDRILRTLLSRKTPLRVYGPDNIAECIEGKLRGYTWNLIKSYPLEVEVRSISGNSIRTTLFRAQGEFRAEDKGTSPFDGVILDEPGHKVRAVELSHGISCLAYSMEESFHINIIKTALEERGLPVGSWLRGLKELIWRGSPDDSTLEVEGHGAMRLSELMEVVKVTRGQKIAYITDITPTDENIAKATDLAEGADTLYCEAFFMGHEGKRAMERNHLTASHTAQIARNSGAERLVTMHYSDKYKGLETDPGQEAQRLFQCGPQALKNPEV